MSRISDALDFAAGVEVRIALPMLPGDATRDEFLEERTNMKNLRFEIAINAPQEKVWTMMIGEEGYRLWTAEFVAGSYFEGSWEKGERIRFLTPDGGGMTSVIAENRPFEFISIKHLGFVKDGVEDTESAATKTWAPLFENYTLTARDGVTEVEVNFEVLPEWEEYMVTTWPKALAKLKEICE